MKYSVYTYMYIYVNKYLLIYKEVNQNKIHAVNDLVKIFFSQLHDWRYCQTF